MTANSMEGPHATRRLGSLKNGNRPGDPNAAPRCGAKTRQGASCQAPAMPNGRCRLHGGKSTGPRTAEGLERCRTAKWKHGRYSREACAERRGMRELLKDCGKLLRFFADCAAKKWPFGQPAISFQQSAISLKSRTD